MYSGSLDIEDQLNRIGVFTVSFSCHPFRYSVEGTDPITLTQSGSTVTNPESFESLPILTLTGEGTVTLTHPGRRSEQELGLYRAGREHRLRQ